MPYIEQKQREKFDSLISKTIDALTIDDYFEAGELNYVISSIVTELFYLYKGYKTANDLIGVLECVKQELYREHISKYENEKRDSNGPII